MLYVNISAGNLAIRVQYYVSNLHRFPQYFQ